MKESVYKNYDEARVLGVSPSSGYELMHEPDFPVLRAVSYTHLTLPTILRV